MVGVHEARGGALAPEAKAGSGGLIAELTLRERQVLHLIADGLTNRQIGEELKLAEKTVKNYVSGLFVKIGVERRTQAAVFGADLKRR
jgi:DNA-binding NarL/FixJ family response regulator